MASISEVARVVDIASRMALDVARRAEEIDAPDCDELLEELQEAERTMRTACAYLRRQARPRTVTGLGETHDRLRETLDRLEIDEDDEDEVDDADEIEIVGLLDRQAGWEEFVEGHPELSSPVTTAKTPGVARVQVAVPPVDDDAVVAALGDAIRQQCEWQERTHGDHSWRRDRADACAVALVLAGKEPLGARCDVVHSDLVKLGQRLSRLGREGKVLRVSRSYERKSYYAPVKEDETDG